MIYTFIVETDQPDEDGNIIELEGILFTNKVVVLDHFKRSAIIGRPKQLEVKDGKFWCTADIPDDFLDRYPAIGFEAIKYRKLGTGTLYHKIRLFAIGLCEKPNPNPSIKTIREQCLT